MVNEQTIIDILTTLIIKDQYGKITENRYKCCYTSIYDYLKLDKNDIDSLMLRLYKNSYIELGAANQYNKPSYIMITDRGISLIRLLNDLLPDGGINKKR